MRHKLIFLAIVAIFFAISGKVYADEIVHIPDSAFKKALIEMGVDRNNDGEIQYSEAEWYPGDWTPQETRDGTLNITHYGSGIKDLTGIRAFTGINKISCTYKHAYVSDSLDLSGMTNLIGIWVYDNKLKYLDVSNCTALSTLNCRDNLLEKINIANCFSLTALDCANNKLTYLNLKNYNSLINIFCSYNHFTNIELPTNNNALVLLGIMNNEISEIDLSKYNKLGGILAHNNKLKKFNFNNGNNKIIRAFNARGNPDLKCITVDDPEWSKENWTNIDELTMFSEDCSISVLETENTNIKIYPNPAKNNLFIEFNCEVKTDIEIYDIQGALQSTQTVQTGYNFVNLDVSKLSKGNYFVKINNQIKKIIIE